MKIIQYTQNYAFWGIIGCLALLLAGLIFDGSLPDASDIHQKVRQQPIQGAYSGPQFTLQHNGHSYVVEPVATYDISALVVGENDLSEDTITKYGLSQDFGLIWGENTSDDRFHEYKFSNSSYVLFAEVPNGTPFNANEIGNVHLLPATPAMAEILDDIEPGAQIRMQGKLINYSRTDLGPGKRKSSLIREDSGMGACEVMLVENVEVMSNPNAKYAWMIWLGGWGMVADLIALVLSTLYIGFANEPDPRAGIDNYSVFGGDEHGSLGDGQGKRI
ncbi:MAG: hypothetical protein V3V10_01710 [Planctomycetota bacterium]